MLPSPLDDDRALVVGSPTSMAAVDGARLPARVDPQPAFPALVRRVGATLSEIEDLKFAREVAQGRWVRLTPETARQLKKHGPVVNRAGETLGVIKGDGGRIAHVMRVDRLAGSGMALANLSGAMTSAAVSRKLDEISESLSEIQATLDRLELRNDLDQYADVVSLNQTLERIALDVRAEGAITSDDWISIAGCEASVKKAMERSRLHLGAIRPGDRATLNRRERVQALKKLVETDRLDWWLDLFVRAELAAARWDGLRLLYRSSKDPAVGDRLAAELAQSIQDRQRERQELGAAIREMLDTTPVNLFDRLRIWSKRDLQQLQTSIRKISDRHGDALGLEAIVVPPGGAAVSERPDVPDNGLARIGRTVRAPNGDWWVETAAPGPRYGPYESEAGAMTRLRTLTDAIRGGDSTST
jgi:hypothetical protein